MKKILLIVIVLFFLIGCASSFSNNKKPINGYLEPVATYELAGDYNIATRTMHVYLIGKDTCYVIGGVREFGISCLRSD